MLSLFVVVGAGLFSAVCRSTEYSTVVIPAFTQERKHAAQRHCSCSFGHSCRPRRFFLLSRRSLFASCAGGVRVNFRAGECYKDKVGVAGHTARATNKHATVINAPMHARHEMYTHVEPEHDHSMTEIHKTRTRATTHHTRAPAGAPTSHKHPQPQALTHNDPAAPAAAAAQAGSLAAAGPTRKSSWAPPSAPRPQPAPPSAAVPTSIPMFSQSSPERHSNTAAPSPASLPGQKHAQDAAHTGYVWEQEHTQETAHASRCMAVGKAPAPASDGRRARGRRGCCGRLAAQTGRPVSAERPSHGITSPVKTALPTWHAISGAAAFPGGSVWPVCIDWTLGACLESLCGFVGVPQSLQRSLRYTCLSCWRDVARALLSASCA